MPRTIYTIEILDSGYVLDFEAEVRSFSTAATLLDELRKRILIERNLWPADPDIEGNQPDTYLPLKPIDLPKGFEGDKPNGKTLELAESREEGRT